MPRQPVLDFHARVVQHPAGTTRLLAAMDASGVDRAVVSAGGVTTLEQLSRQVVEGGHIETDADNDAVLAACAHSGGRLIPFFFANPHRDPAVYRECAGEFTGVEISPAVHGVPLTDDRTRTLVATAAEFEHPVYVVCIGRPGSRAGDLVELATRFPSVPFVLGHCGFIGIDVHALTVVRDTANIVVETSGCFTVVVRVALELLGADRVLFGTEFPLQHPSVELAKYQALEIADDVWSNVAWHNGHRLLGRSAVAPPGFAT